jgi:NTE family protein
VIRYYIRQPIGEPLQLDRLQTDMGTLYGLDYFDQVQYRVVHKGDANHPGDQGPGGAAAPTTCAWA